MRDYFVFDGIRSSDIGVQLQNPVAFTGAEPKVQTISVPGRNGDLHFYENAFSNIRGTARCFILDHDASALLAAANRWLLGSNGYHKLETSDDESMFYMARCKNAGEIAIRNKVLAPFTIDFDCAPQHYYKSGENKIQLSEAGTIENPGLSGNPLIRVFGSGSGTITVNDTIVELIDMVDFIDIDCEMQNAYRGSQYANNNIRCSNFPKLTHGENEIHWSGGVTRIEITPRWWTI